MDVPPLVEKAISQEIQAPVKLPSTVVVSAIIQARRGADANGEEVKAEDHEVRFNLNQF